MHSNVSTAHPDLYAIDGWVGEKPVFHMVIHDCPRQFKEALFIFEHNFVYSVLRKHAGNVTLSAQVMGVSRRTLNRLVENLEIDVSSIRKMSRIVSSSKKLAHFEAAPLRTAVDE